MPLLIELGNIIQGRSNQINRVSHTISERNKIQVE
jgi:hypothetical protein